MVVSMSRTASASFAFLAIALPGCAVGADPPDGTGKSQPAAPLLDVDPLRAHAALSDIEPALEAPVRPESVKPLSHRAATQVETSRKLIAQQRYTEAGIELERALRYDPKHHELHRALAALHWQAGNVERARSHATEALEANPDDATAHYIIGRCKASDGDDQAAITAYRTALLCSDFESDAEVAAACHYHLAGALEAEGYLEAALSQYAAFEQRAAASDASDAGAALPPLVHSRRRETADAESRILERLGRFVEAAEALLRLPADVPDPVRSSRCARLWLRAGRFAEALEVARTIQSDDQEVIQLLFEIHERAGHPERIIPDLRARLADRPDEPRLAVDLADALVRIGRAGEAEQELRRFLAEHPSADAVRTRLIDLLITRSAWTETLAVCSDGIKRQPAQTARFEAKIVQLAADERALTELVASSPVRDDADHASVYLQGVLARAAGRLERAEMLLRRSHREAPTFVPARVALARMYLEAYRYDEALKVAQRTDADVPEDARLEKVLGEIYERLDKLDQAELHFKAAMQLDRSDAEVMLALAKVLQRSGEVNRAQLQLRALLGHDPGHQEARETLAYAYLAEGKTDAAIEQFEKLRELAVTPGAKARCEALLAQRHTHDPRTYRNTLIASMDSSPPDAQTWLALAHDYGEFEQEQARQAYLEALAIDPDSEEALIGLMRAEARLLEFESAIAHVKKLLPRRPNRHAWRLLLFDFHTVVQDHEAALALARRQEARDDLDDATRTAFRSCVVRALRSLGRRQEVLEQIEAWSHADPDDRHAAIRLADEYIAQDRPLEAVPILEALYRSDVDDRSGLVQLVSGLAAAGLHDRASQYALEWVHQDPEGDVALSVLVSVLADADRMDDALELIDNKLLRTENREHFQDLAGRLLGEAERHDDRIDLTERLIGEVVTQMRRIAENRHDRPAERPDSERRARWPNEPFSLDSLSERLDVLRGRLALELYAARRYREAERSLMGWLDIPGPRRRRVDLAYLKLLAACRQAQGHDDQAAETLERALRLDPMDVSLNNDVAYGWIDRGVHLDEAEERIRFALSNAPTESAYLDTYGWLLYKKGLFVEAKKWLSRAVRARDTDEPVIFDHLGDACWRLGETEDAIQHWTAAMAAVVVVREDREDDLSSDQRRVRDTTQRKIDAARDGQIPDVAPLAAPSEEENVPGDGAP